MPARTMFKVAPGPQSIKIVSSPAMINWLGPPRGGIGVSRGPPVPRRINLNESFTWIPCS